MEINEEVLYTKKGTLRKRKPKQSQMYFTQDTEDAIIAYLKETDQNKRNRIYNNGIAYAFYKLCENIIHTFKFYYTDSTTIEELKYEVIKFLLEKLHLFNHSKNVNDKLNKIIVKEFNEEYENGSFIQFTNNSVAVTQHQIDEFITALKVSDECYERIREITPPKAYSYFGTIAKRYLIAYNEENYKKLQERVDISEVITDDNNEKQHTIQIENPPGEEINLEKFVNLYVEYVTNSLEVLFPKGKDAKVADAILELFRKRESLSILENKKALYIYIREMIDVETPHITKIVKRLKIIYKDLFNYYYEHGHIEGYKKM